MAVNQIIPESVEMQGAFELSAEGGLSSIEQLQKLSAEKCTNPTSKYITGINDHEHTIILSRTFCKTWGCPSCGARNARIWIARILHYADGFSKCWYFLTITAHEKKRKMASVANLRRGWKLFYNRIRDALGKKMAATYFIKVWEQHADGTFHIHVITNICLGSRFAKDVARECGMGFIAEWKRVRKNAGQAIGYIAKYSLKNGALERAGVKWPKNLRRIEISRNWPKLPDLRDKNWHWVIKDNREHQLNGINPFLNKNYQLIDTVRDGIQ